MSKYNWTHEQTKEINEQKEPDVIMSDGMSGRPMAICFPFYLAGYFITTPQEWLWLQNHFKDYQTNTQ